MTRRERVESIYAAGLVSCIGVAIAAGRLSISPMAQIAIVVPLWVVLAWVLVRFWTPLPKARERPWISRLFTAAIFFNSALIVVWFVTGTSNRLHLVAVSHIVGQILFWTLMAWMVGANLHLLFVQRSAPPAAGTLRSGRSGGR